MTDNRKPPEQPDSYYSAEGLVWPEVIYGTGRHVPEARTPPRSSAIGNFALA